MKKMLSYILIIFISIFIITPNAEASKTYIRGIVKGSSNKVYNAFGNQLKSDTNGNIYLNSPEAIEVLGEEGSNYRIRFMYNGFMYEGYISKNAVTTMTYTTDDAYEQALISAGFPSDYASKLAVLHAIHPNWNFAPSLTGGVIGGMDFYTAVNGEASVVARNVIKTSNNSLKSTADGAYKNGQWIDLAGNGWHAASAQTIAFYMDPRNFLDESHIFMFENAGFNAVTQTKEVVNKILAGTFMNNPFDCYQGANMCSEGTYYFADTFLTVGEERKVSPVHLATRVVQEQGRNGSVLSLGKGYNGEYIGFYNFFNVGAAGKTDEEVIKNGLIYAMNKNWNNQHASIHGGSSLIANGYIARGQSTRYYQKINTIAKPYYGNQYMQNIQAPYTEGYSTYVSYYRAHETIESWDSEVYDFLIPVYTNMGKSTTLDVSQNSDTTLKSMTVEGCKLSPEFQSSAYTYDCFVEKSKGEIKITAEATNPNALVTNPGVVPIAQDELSTSVIVKAVNGQTATYTINIHRIEHDGLSPVEILNGIGIKASEEYASNIVVGSDISNIISSVENKYHFASIKITEADGTEKLEGVVKTGQMITITNNGVSATFKIVIYGDINGDSMIDIRDLLGIQKHLVKSKVLTDVYLKSSDINKDNVIDIRDLLLEQKYLVGAYTINQG